MSVWTTYTFLMRAVEDELEASEAITFGRFVHLGSETNETVSASIPPVKHREGNEV
ncbi:hypothetical protein QA600_16100 [Natronococcus sp. A-GB1]|uniref:hypothetical protein n=1 Tax=Natronococcus sp. A-GB1 TaxID=3037648 RepID=UPI00242018CB|nr:hypothetical protein [Natronococcus sp. A-GB1]MDG5760857.1 hypothetical protein [Natronococcus sp. A-GB1]